MDGDSLPVSAFVDHVDGQFELGASAYEKRGVAVTVPDWDADKCIQCNNCAYVCPHATIRPFALTEEEATDRSRALPRSVRSRPARARASITFTMAVSPLDCMGCGVCVGVCPDARPSPWFRRRASSTQQEVFDYMVAKVSEKKDMQDSDRQGQPVHASRCLSSPAPAQAAPRLLTPAWSPSCSATACISPTPPAAPPSGAARPLPLPTPSTAEGPRPRMGELPVRGQRRAWSRYVHRVRRPSASAWPTRSRQLIAVDWTDCRAARLPLRSGSTPWNDGEANKAATKALIAAS